MATHAQFVRVCAQMKIGLGISRLSRFVNNVTGVAPHIERRMPAPICGDIHPVDVTFEAKIFLPVA